MASLCADLYVEIFTGATRHSRRRDLFSRSGRCGLCPSVYKPANLVSADWQTTVQPSPWQDNCAPAKDERDVHRDRIEEAFSQADPIRVPDRPALQAMAVCE